LGDASDKGFIGDVSQQYRNNGYTTIQSNLGVDGQTSQGLRSEIHQPSIQTLIRSANAILISIGGNDLNDAAGLPKINTQKIAATQAAFSTNLTDILTTIRKENPQSPILLVGLYNPYANIAYDRAVTDSMVQSWDAKVEGIVEKFPNTVMVQTFDLFELHDNQLLYVDHFHPNQMGYQLIANRIWQDIKGVSTQ
jgi:lysophospholipase L1-like esterase